MRWLRENWLDFLIFLLIVLVAAGIVLYLTGINPFARRQAASPPQVPAPALATPAPASPAPAPAKPPEPVVTVVPLPQAPVEPPASSQEAKPSPAGSPAPAAASPASAAASSPAGTYRVVVGAFANPENAARLRQDLERRGYPARLEPVGNLTRVVVGPYPSEAEARRVAQALDLQGVQVYRGQGPAAPAQGTLYLQVGAFQKEANALALAAKLREQGLPVVLVKDGVFRVRVGPVGEGEKEAVRAKVAALGLEALEVR